MSSTSSRISSTSLAGLPQGGLQVGAGKLRRLEQRQQPRERRAQLVGDRGREAGAKLVVLGSRHRLSIA